MLPWAIRSPTEEFPAIQLQEELQQLLASHFEGLETRLSTVRSTGEPATEKPKAAPPPTPGKKGELLAAEIVEEPEGPVEDTRLPDYSDEGADEGEELEFLNEDDIMDVDKLRGIFQSVLDEGISDGHESREGEDASADLLFLEDALLEDEHEPEVTFSLDEKDSGKQKKSKKK